MHTGSFGSIRFSVDYHTLSIIEVDGTLVAPYNVTGLTLAVAQRYSVLLRTDNTTTGGPFWMRAELQSDMFTYDEPGQNLDIRGTLRSVLVFLAAAHVSLTAPAHAHNTTCQVRPLRE